MRAASPTEVRVVTEPADFAALRSGWDALLAKCRNPSVFLTHEWFDAAWQWRRSAAQLYVLCLHRGPELVAALPLVLERAADGGRWERCLEFLAVPDTQCCDLFAPDEERVSAATAFANELQARQRDWDVLRLRYLPETSLAATCFGDAMRGNRCAVAIRPTAGNPYIALDTTWEEYYSTRSRSLKKASNLAANRLRKAGEVKIEWLAPGTGDAADVARVLESAIALSGRSWKSRTGDSLDNVGPQAFIRRLSESAHQRGWLSVWLLALDGVPFAMEYQLVADGCVFALRSDFDEDCERRQISPGSHLSRHLLEQLFGRGLRRYLMGPGENAYKYRWTEQVLPTTELTVYGRSLRGRALEWWELGLKPLARSLRERAKPRVPPAQARDHAGGSAA